MRNLINRALAAKKQHLLTLICALCALSFIPTSMMATDYTVEPKGDGNAPAASFALPIFMGNSTNSAGAFYGSITQCIFLPSEFLDEDENVAPEGEITHITFYYTAKSSTATTVTRNVAIYLMEIDPSISEYPLVAFPYKDIYGDDQNCYQSYFLYNESNKVGERVYNSTLSTEDVSSGTTKQVTLPLSKSFHYSGTKNLVMTVLDKSATTQVSSNLRFLISSTKETVPSEVGHPRFAYTFWANSENERASWITDGNYNFSGKLSDFYGKNSTDNKKENNQKLQRSYVPKTTFTFSDEVPTAPDVPTGLAATPDITTASLSWNEASGAASYKLYYSADGTNFNELASPATNSYDWSDLTASTTYYVKVSAVNGVGESALSEPISFTTQAPHIHDGITFEPWSNASAMPTSGNYYLASDVYLTSDWNVTENINLCLNGHEVYTETNSIQVKDGATFAIYDNEGGGRIYGYFVAVYPKYGLINIENGGTLVLSEGTIQNLYGSYEEDDDPDDKSLSNAIYNNGTLKLSGALTFTSYHADIYLGSNKYITIESEKPLINSEPYSVYKSGISVITSGWANMNGADPKDYFVSANTSLNIKMGETEAEFYPVISLSEKNTNTAIGTYSGQMVDVNLTRSLTSSQYNTFCLPFALTDAQLEEIFGADYDLREFESSSLDGDVLSLTFSDPLDALEAGKPYLLKPSVDVANPSFEGVTIAETSPVDQTSDANISFHATFAPTELEGGNKNLLFLGAENELFYPASTANIKAFRAYFELKGAAKLSAPKARIVKKQDSATGVENQMVNGKCGNHKFLKDGQLYILREGKMYNVLGMEK